MRAEAEDSPITEVNFEPFRRSVLLESVDPRAVVSLSAVLLGGPAGYERGVAGDRHQPLAVETQGIAAVVPDREQLGVMVDVGLASLNLGEPVDAPADRNETVAAATVIV